MIKIAKLFGLCTLLVVLLALPALSQQISYESAAVGRIVGETPEEMRGQLVYDEIQLQEASYFSGFFNLMQQRERAEAVAEILDLSFSGDVDGNVAHVDGRWSWGGVKDSISSWGGRSLLLLEAKGSVNQGRVTADSPSLFDRTIDVGSFDWGFNGKPLVVFDSDYAGVHVPKRYAFVSSVAGGAVVIAPTAIPDKNFVKVFACNLGKYRTLGEAYTNARNNYYWQSNKPSGIALMSYELYGNPASLVSVPVYDEAAISEHCGDFLKNYTEKALSVLTVSSASVFDAPSWLVNYTGANNPYDRPEPVDVNWSISGGWLNVSANEWGGETLWAMVGDLLNVPASTEGVVFKVSLAGREFSPSNGIASIGFVADMEQARAAGDAQCVDGGLVRSGPSCSLKADSISCSRGAFAGTSSIYLGSCTDAGCSNHPFGNLLQEVGGVNDHAGDFAALRLQMNTTHARCSWGEDEGVTNWKAHGVSLGGVVPVISFQSGGSRDFDSFAANRISVNGLDVDLGSGIATPFSESRKFSITGHSVVDDGNFSVLVADGTSLSSSDGDLVLPVASLVQSFPLRTVVTGVDNVKFSNSVDFVIPNLPSWAGSFVERVCGYESRNASLEVFHSVNGNRLELFTTIRPVDVASCSEGRLRLYTEVEFDVNYFTYSPVLISDVIVPSVAAPNEALSANVTLSNVKGGSFSGEITLSDGSKVIAEKSVEFSGESELFVALPFNTGDREGIQHYTLAFVQNGEEKAFYSFSLRVKSMDLSLQAPLTAGESGSVRLLVDNRLRFPVQSSIQAYTVNGAEVTSQSIDTTLKPGVNEILLSYEGLKREDERYDFLVTVPYGIGKVSASTVLVTNHPPFLKQIGEVIVTEGDAVRLSPEAVDADGDAVSIKYSGRLFAVGKWQTRRGDAGVYEVVVTASDGLLSTSQNVQITVLKDNTCYGVVDEDGACNSAPVFDKIRQRTVRENELLEFVLTAADEENDDLKFSSDELPEGASFNSDTDIFRWEPASSQSGAYAITFTVSDGFSSDSETVVITVQGVNHAPVIESFTPDLNNLVVDEGRSMRFEVVASDPDSDKIFYRWTLDGKAVYWMPYYTYSPNYSDAGEHVINVSVDDKHLSDSRETHVIVQDAVCVSSETRPCDFQSGVCKGSAETCSNGEWHGCGAAEYGGGYEVLEKSCDGVDNDCDGSVDEPENLFSQRPCGNDGTELLSCVNGNWVPKTECMETCGRLGEPCCLGSLCRISHVCNYAANRCEISGYWDESWE